MTELQSQLVPVQLSGLDLKDDPRQLVAGKLLAAQNIVYTTPGRISKRYGTTALATTTNAASPYPSSLTTGSFVASYGTETLMGDGFSLWSFSSSENRWIRKGDCPTVKLTANSIYRSNTAQVDPQIGINATVKMVSWQGATGLMVQVSELGSGNVLNTMNFGASSISRIVNLGGALTLFYTNGSGQINSATWLTTNFSLHSNLMACVSNFDVTTDGTSFFITSATTSSITTQLFSSTLVAGSAVVQSSATFPYSSGYDVFSNQIFITIGDNSGGNARAGLYAVNAACTAITVAATYTSTYTGQQLASNVIVSAGGTIQLFFSLYGTQAADGTYPDAITYQTTYLSGLLNTPTLFARSVQVVSKPWLMSYGGGVVPCIVAWHQSSLQSTYFYMGLLNNARIILAKSAPGQVGQAAPVITNPVYLNGVLHHVGLQNFYLFTQTFTIVAGAQSQSLAGVVEYVLDFTFTNPNITNLNNNLLIGGGIVRGYDGLNVNETNFNIYPEYLTGAISSPNPPSSSLAVGKYGFQMTYEWIDNQGQRHQSAPSPVLSVSTTTTGQGITLSLPTLRLTDKKNVTIVVWATDTNGSVYYRTQQPTSAIINDPTVDYIAYQYTGTIGLIGNQQLYTTGEVTNSAPPAAVVMGTAQNRTVLIPSETPTSYWFSKENPPGSPPEFANVFTANCDPTDGPITAVQQMDSNLFLFKRNTIFYVAGTGPANSGTGSNFTDAALIPTSTGSVTPYVALTSEGMLYQSANGIWLMNRSNNDTYVGAAVESYNSVAITSAEQVPATTQVRFTLANGQTLVYDYFVKNWSTFTTYNGVSAALVNGVYSVVSSTGAVVQEATGTYADSGAYIPMSLTTGWMSFNGLQGFQRARKMYLLGDYFGPHNLTVTIKYDYQTPAQVVPFAVPAALSPYQFRVYMLTQKCQAIQVTITDSVLSTANQAFNLSGISFEVGAKKGFTKNNSSNQFGG